MVAVLETSELELRALARRSALRLERRRPVTRLADRSGIAGTAYDTAWLASLHDPNDPASPRYPMALQWLVENQHADGSWGGAVRYQHDRVICTLAALTALCSQGRREIDRVAIEEGTRYLWRHGHLLKSEPVELVGFELLLPALVQRAQDAGVNVPPHLDVYKEQRLAKLQLIPPQLLYSPRTTAVHSLEFLGEQVDWDRLPDARGTNGSIGNSPAATAVYLSHTEDAAAAAYLDACLEHAGGATVPVLHPCETFELLWAAYHLWLAGVPAAELLTADERRELLGALGKGGVSLSPETFPIPDADDTAVALLLLHDLGDDVDAAALGSFKLKDGHYASFPHERHPSVGVNLHVLHALLRVTPDDPTIDHLVDYVIGQQIDGLYWIDKWHISPYYATAHALAVLSETERARPAVQRSLEWVRQTQRSDGAWGFYDEATLEETAYGVLALALAGDPEDAPRIRAGQRHLAAEPIDTATLPPLWVDKCLYLPPLIVRAAIEGACRV